MPMTTKKETDPNINKLQISCSRQWKNNKNPRIVRVPRTFGGKDRHSKVYTVKGLRDRRIRLSAPTAIQLYDLQDRLGLSQPSKVIDWLLEAAKNDIDKLPPLPMLPQFQDPNLLVPSSYNMAPDFFPPYTKDMEQGNQDQGFVAQTLFPNMPFTFSNPYNFQYWDVPNLSLSRFGEGYSSYQDQTGQDPHQQQPNGSLSSSHLYFTPPGANIIPPVIPQLLPPYNMAQTMENANDMRSQIYSHFLTPTTLPIITRTATSPENDNRRKTEMANRNL